MNGRNVDHHARMADADLAASVRDDNATNVRPLLEHREGDRRDDRLGHFAVDLVLEPLDEFALENVARRPDEGRDGAAARREGRVVQLPEPQRFRRQLDANRAHRGTRGREGRGGGEGRKIVAVGVVEARRFDVVVIEGNFDFLPQGGGRGIVVVGCLVFWKIFLEEIPNATSFLQHFFRCDTGEKKVIVLC